MNISQEKNRIEQKLHVYYKRWERHKKLAANNHYKMRLLENTLKRRIEKREILEKCVKQFKDFFLEDVKNRGLDKKYKDKCSLFAKFALENGVRGKDVAEYLGFKRTKTVYERRQSVQKKFLIDVNLKCDWNRFQNTIKESEEKSS